MIVYPKEKALGLEDKILASASIKLESPIKLVDSFEINKDILDIVLASNNQSDLNYISTLMVSTGWNTNDDIFTIAEMWKARQTPVNKPLNIEHDSKNIVGHITGVSCIDEEGNLLDIALDSVDKPFHIITNAVIYKYWHTDGGQHWKSKIKEVQQLIDEICNDEWMVSMECLTANFDYALLSEENEMFVIPRNEDSSFLSKYLRVYGGTGVYKNHKIGRLLKDYFFSGEGIVKNPANPKSDILTCSGEIMSDNNKNTEKELAEATEKLVKANNVIKELEVSVNENETRVIEANKKIEDLTQANKVLTDSVNELTSNLNKANTELLGVNKEFADYKSLVTKENRLAALAKFASETEAADYYQQFGNLDDATFANMLSLLEKSNKNHASNKPENQNSENQKSEKKVPEPISASLDNVQHNAEPTLGVPTESVNAEQVRASRLKMVSELIEKKFSSNRR